MQIACVYPERQHWPKFQWVAAALRSLGHDVRVVRSAGALRAADAECDVVLLEQKGAGLNVADMLPLVERRQSVWVEWRFDLFAIQPGLPLREQRTISNVVGSTGKRRWSDHVELMRGLDLVFVKERSLLDEYADLGINAEYLDQGCPETMPACEHREFPEWDVLLWGSASKDWRERREDASSLLSEGYAVAWAGWPVGDVPTGALPLPFCEAVDLPALASRASCVLCADIRHDLDGYWSDRLWMALGMGACVLRRETPGLPTGPFWRYRDARRLADLVRWLRKSRETRASYGAAARSWVMGGHTVRHRCEELVERCERLTRGRAAPAAARGR